MEACELVRLIVNKTIVPAQPKRRGNPGYGQLKAIRILVYARLKDYKTTHAYTGTSKNTQPKPKYSDYTTYPTEPPLAAGGDATSTF